MPTRLTWVEGPDGKRTAVTTPLREMKVARLIFIGTPAILLPEQEQIATSLTERHYDNDQEGLDELLERARDAWQTQGYFKEELRKAYAKKAYINFVVAPTFNIDETRDSVTLFPEIQEGKQFRIGKIQVPGGQPATGSSIDEGFGTDARQYL